MNPCRSVPSHCVLSKLFGLIGLALVLCVMSTAGSSTGGKDSTGTQFTLDPIPASVVHHSWQVPHIRNDNGTSSNWSGYAVYQNASSKGKNAKPATTFSAVSGSWVVPGVSPSSTNTYSSTWVGLDGYNDGTVEQIGIEQDWDSSSNQAVYYAWFEMYPDWSHEIVGFDVVAGDTISASVEYDAANNDFTVTITNARTGVTWWTTQGASSAKRLSAEWVEEAPWSGGVLPLANFGKVEFFNCSATTSGGVTGAINDAAWTRDQITMETVTGNPKHRTVVIKTQPSALSADGTAFSVTWYHE